MSRILLACAVVVAVLFALVPADAASPPTPFSIENCASPTPGHTISAAGKYKLTQAVSDCQANPIISIEASNVTVDLSGMMLDGDGTNCSTAINVAGSFTHVTVKNGTIRDCTGNGIDMSATDHSTISSVNIRSTGGATGTAAAIGDFSTFKGNAVTGNKKVGLSAGDSNVITRNTFESNGTIGGDWALVAGKQNAITKNTFNDNVSDAMFVLGDSNLFKQNIANGNGGDGICTLGKFNKIIKNTTIGNDDVGIETSNDSNTITGNTVRGNGGDGIKAAQKGSVVSGNNVSGNEGNGILIDDGNASIIGVKVLSNRANGNLGDGIRLPDVIDDSSLATSVKKNTVNGNGGQGIHTNPPPNPLGAHTNHASGNVVAMQCDSFLC